MSCGQNQNLTVSKCSYLGNLERVMSLSSFLRHICHFPCKRCHLSSSHRILLLSTPNESAHDAVSETYIKHILNVKDDVIGSFSSS